MNDKKDKLIEIEDSLIIRSDGSVVKNSISSNNKPLEMYDTNDFTAINSDGSIKEKRIGTSENSALQRFASVKKMVEKSNYQEALRILSTDQHHDADWHLCIANIYIRMERFKEAKENILIAKEYDASNRKWESAYKFYKLCLKKYESEPKAKSIVLNIPNWGPEPELGGYPVEVHNCGD